MLTTPLMNFPNNKWLTQRAIRSVSVLIFSSCLTATADEWEQLIDKDLSKWEAWTGVPHTSLEIDAEGKSDDGKSGVPLGKGDPLKVYRYQEGDSGDPQLYISGQIYAGLATKKEYKNYHLSMQVKWGGKKWAPRLEAPRDSGILYHCKGPDGVFWNVWKQSLECQVQENDNGDYFRIGNVGCYIPSIKIPDAKRPRFDPKGEWSSVGIEKGSYSVQRSENYEKNGDWNTVEIMTIGDRAAHFSNGKLVLILKDATQVVDGVRSPLTEGQIQIQSEGAEVTYRDLKIKQLSEFPENVEKLFPAD